MYAEVGTAQMLLLIVKPQLDVQGENSAESRDRRGAWVSITLSSRPQTEPERAKGRRPR
jgi:hypothetical protein